MLIFLLGTMATSSNVNSETDKVSEGSWLKGRQYGVVDIVENRIRHLTECSHNLAAAERVCVVNIARPSNFKRSQKSRLLCKIAHLKMLAVNSYYVQPLSKYICSQDVAWGCHFATSILDYT